MEVVLTPAIRPLGKVLHACALAHPEISLFVEESLQTTPDIQAKKLTFRLGGPPGGVKLAIPVGVEEIVAIMNKNNPISRLSTEELANLFSGKIMGWEEIGVSSLAVQVWIYPQGDEARELFEAAVLKGMPVSNQAQLAPDPQAMLEAIATDAGAIGFLPHAWLSVAENDRNVKTIVLGEELAAALRVPVLGLLAGQPSPAARILLGCLQGEVGRKASEALYDPWER